MPLQNSRRPELWDRAAGHLPDTVDPREAFERLSRQHERILNAAGEGIYEIDAEGRTRFVNPAAARLLGWEPQTLVGRPVHEILHGAGAAPGAAASVAVPIDEDICPIHAALLDRVESYVKEDLFWTRDGASVPVEYICTPITEHDRIVGAVIAFQNIAERRLIEREIVRLRDLALEAARLRLEFLANMSHEIRTPLNGIIGMTSILLETDLSPEQRRVAGIIKASGDALLTIVNDILDFSKIDAGKLRFETLDFDLRDVVASTIESFVERARIKGLDLFASVADDVPTALRGDPGRLRQVLTNLLGNALKFTERGQVTLRVTGEPDAGAGRRARPHVILRVEVRDTGIGVAPVQERHLFQPFVQADTSTTRMYGGTGLGLAISKQIVEQMGGAIGVESEPGHGSLFWFTARFDKQADVDRRRSDGGVVAPLPAPPHGAPSARTVPDVMGRSAGQAVALAPLPASPDGRRPRILVAEDNVVNQQVALHMLQKLGLAAEAVATGHEALEALSRIPYDLVLMDCQMPHLDGYGATRELRRREGAGRHTRVIGLTGFALPTDCQRCLDAGMDDYLAKPMTIASLEAIVHRHLNDQAVEERATAVPPALVGIVDAGMWQDLHAVRKPDDDFTRVTFALYLDYATGCLDTLRDASDACDLPALARAAESLNSSSTILGLITMAALSAPLGQAARQGALAETLQVLPRLEQEFVRVKAALESQLSSTAEPGT